MPKHPTVAFYRGAYVSYNSFSVKFGKEGKQGKAFCAGFSWGFTKPLYFYKSGNSLDFEAGISAGLAYTTHTTYTHDRESNCHIPGKTEDWTLNKMPVISELRAGFVYRFGNYPSTGKYRWRYDCDLAYQDIVRDKILKRARMEDSLRHTRDIRKVIEQEFNRIYNLKFAEAAANGEAAKQKSGKTDNQKKKKVKPRQNAAMPEKQDARTGRKEDSHED